MSFACSSFTWLRPMRFRSSPCLTPNYSSDYLWCDERWLSETAPTLASLRNHALKMTNLTNLPVARQMRIISAVFQFRRLPFLFSKKQQCPSWRRSIQQSRQSMRFSTIRYVLDSDYYSYGIDRPHDQSACLHESKAFSMQSIDLLSDRGLHHQLCSTTDPFTQSLSGHWLCHLKSWNHRVFSAK